MKQAIFFVERSSHSPAGSLRKGPSMARHPWHAGHPCPFNAGRPCPASPLSRGLLFSTAHLPGAVRHPCLSRASVPSRRIHAPFSAASVPCAGAGSRPRAPASRCSLRSRLFPLRFRFAVLFCAIHGAVTLGVHASRSLALVFPTPGRSPEPDGATATPPGRLTPGPRPCGTWVSVVPPLSFF